MGCLLSVTILVPCHVKTNEAVLQMQIKSSSISWTGTGEWLDEADLTEKFKNKPTQLKHILAHGKTFKDPASNVLLYEAMSYKSEYKESEQRTEERKRQLITKETIKPPKKLKVAKIPDGTIPAPQDEVQVPIPPAAEKKIASFLSSAPDLVAKLATLVAEAKSAQLKQYVPAFAVTTAGNMITEMEEVLTYLKRLSQDKRCGKFELKKLLPELVPKKDELKKLTDKLQSYVTDAEGAHLAEANA